MKITLIKASQDNYFKSYKKYQGSPPQNIFSAAAALQGKAKVEMYDETSGMKAPSRINGDLVVIYMSTPDAYRGYELADNYMRQGTKVILGGLHPTFMITEALLHAHAVIKGESDLLWDEILADISINKLKAVYEATQLQDLSSLAPYSTNLISPDVYKGGYGLSWFPGGDVASSATIARFLASLKSRPIALSVT